MIYDRKLFAVIPAFNTGDSVLHVVEGLHEHVPEITIIVVDDGSEQDLCKSMQGIVTICVRHSQNRGKGAALWTGISVALERGAELILTLDADGQHDPADAQKLFRTMEKTKCDIIVGDRMGDLAKMPKHRILSNKITSNLLSWRIGQYLPDSQSGYRLLTSAVVANFNPKCSRFDFESELLIKAGLAGFMIGSVSIKTKYDVNSKSEIEFSDVARFIKMYFRSFF